MSPEILNPESKVGTMNPKTFESGNFCRVNAFLSNPDIFPPAIFECAVELKWRNESKVVVVLMAIDGGRWLPLRFVTGQGSLLICNG